MTFIMCIGEAFEFYVLNAKRIPTCEFSMLAFYDFKIFHNFEKCKDKP